MLSVVLCTYNPEPPLLAWALESVRDQKAAPGLEVVLVDNNSRPPLPPGLLAGALPGWNARTIRETSQGLVHARIAGIRATTAPLIVFLDDDNCLDPGYLQTAVEIATNNPSIGCFGGKAAGVFQSDVSSWKAGLLGYVGVRDYGAQPITSANDVWGEWEPIGAGMVCRRDVAGEFVRLVESRKHAERLGRAGSQLMSGEDSLIAHAAYRLGYSCSYQPSLKLSHWMPASRLTFGNLARTVTGHGRSQAVLQTIKGKAVPKPGVLAGARHLAQRYYEHLRHDGVGAGTVKWCWEYGYLTESRRIGS